MVFLLLVSVLFSGTLTLLILVGGNGGRGEMKMASASTPSANEQAKDVVLVHTVQLKVMIKAQISERMTPIGISDVAIARNDDFWRPPEIDFRYEIKGIKVMIDFKFDALYR